MSFTRCPFCEHGNPADAKFCSECGGALHLAPCTSCGAVNQVTANTCYQCRSPLPGRGAPGPVPLEPADLLLESSPLPFTSRSLPVATVPEILPVAVVSAPTPRWRSRAIVGTVVVVAVAALGYSAYRQRGMPGEPPPQSAGNEASERGTATGVVRRNSAAEIPGSPAGAGAGSASAAILPTGTALAPPARAASEQPRRTGPAAVERPQAPREGGATGPISVEPCTEGAAALGLCVMSPVRKKAPETAATLEVTIERVPATSPGSSSGQGPARPQACTEAVAALGLCPPGTTQGR